MKILFFKIYKNIYFPFIIFIFAIFLILLRINFKLEADEGVWLKNIQEKGVFGFIHYQIFNWQPTISSFTGFAIIHKNIMLWRIISTILASIGMFCIFKMITNQNEQRRIEINTFICSIFFFISPYTITSGVMWVVGSTNYLWNAVAMLIALIPFIYAIQKKKISSKFINIFIFIATIWACYHPQTLAILTCFGFLTIMFLFLTKKKIFLLLISQYILILLNCSLFIYLSKFGNRFFKELHYYPDFNLMSIIDKIFQGINWTHFHFINSSNLLLFLLTLLIFINIYNKNKENKLLYIISGIPMLYCIFNIIPFDIIMKNVNINNSNAVFWSNSNSPYSIDDTLFSSFFNTMLANPRNFLYGIKDLMPSMTGFIIIYYIAVLLYITFESKEDKFITIILYFAALFSGYVMGFSPTIFASGSRVFFISNILMVLIVAKLFVQALENGLKYSRIVSCSFIIFTILLWLQFFLYFPKAILWL